jgi:hypothetical protein
VDLLLLGSAQPLVFDLDVLERNMSELWVRADLARVGVRGALDIAAMLQTGGAALGQVLEGATVNTDDNGLVEFAAPKALYLDTQDANMAMLQGSGSDPMTVVRALVQTPENPDKLRLEMIRRWVRRAQAPRAARSTAFFEDGSFKPEADALLRKSR